jgi:hypothetical protein
MGKSGYGMRAADTIELRDAEKMRRGKSLWRGLGRNYGDARDARYLRGNGRHE